MANGAGLFQRSALLILIVTGMITVGLMAHLTISPPDFNTDLGDFAPDSEANKAHDRIHQHFPNETRPLFIEVRADDGSNILSIENLQTMDEHLSIIENASAKRGDMITVWTTAPGILQLALDEEGEGEALANVSSWAQIIDLIFEDDTTCSMTSDDQLLSAATYASSALLNKDLSLFTFPLALPRTPSAFFKLSTTFFLASFAAFTFFFLASAAFLCLSKSGSFLPPGRLQVFQLQDLSPHTKQRPSLKEKLGC